MIFPANANELKVPITNSLVFDDDIHEANEETFLILMTVDFSNPKEAVALQPSRDVLIFNIIDNDGTSFFNDLPYFLNISTVLS